MMLEQNWLFIFADHFLGLLKINKGNETCWLCFSYSLVLVKSSEAPKQIGHLKLFKEKKKKKKFGNTVEIKWVCKVLLFLS